MKLSIAAENPMERLVAAFGLAPAPIMHTHMSFLRARAILVATKLGLFEALADRPLPAREVADRCGTAVAPTEKLLNALVGAEYVAFGDGAYALTPMARRWTLASSPHSLRDKLLFEFIEWAMLERLEDFVRTGEPLDLHGGMDGSRWAAYQRAMRALAGLSAPEIVARTPVPRGATAMLDIGGSHGYLSVAMCRRHPALHAVVLDLPDAVAHAAPILAREGMGDRVVHRGGDVLADDLGEAQWDLVFMSQLAHHFDAATNRALAARVARALRPGGVFVVLDTIRPASPGASGQVGALLDLYFALTSESGTWTIEEIASWQRDAGLVPRRPVRLRTLPGAVEVIAARP